MNDHSFQLHYIFFLTLIYWLNLPDFSVLTRIGIELLSPIRATLSCSTGINPSFLLTADSRCGFIQSVKMSQKVPIAHRERITPHRVLWDLKTIVMKILKLLYTHFWNQESNFTFSFSWLTHFVPNTNFHLKLILILISDLKITCLRIYSKEPKSVTTFDYSHSFVQI